MTASVTACSFSIVVATRDRPRQLHDCLEALCALEWSPHRGEIIVVDDGSSADIATVVDAYRTGPLPISLVRQRPAGPGAARNRGARAATGEYLAFTDDDCRPRRDWLQNVSAALAPDPERLIGGHTHNALSDNPFACASQRIVDAFYAFYNRSGADARLFASNNLVVPRAGFWRIGGFDERFGFASEDRDLCERWLAAGGRMTYAPAAIVEHRHPLTFAQFCRQHFRYGLGAARYHGVRERSAGSDFNAALAFHLRMPALIAAQLRTCPSARERTLAVLLACLWFVCNGLGFATGLVRGWSRPTRAAASRPAGAAP